MTDQEKIAELINRRNAYKKLISLGTHESLKYYILFIFKFVYKRDFQFYWYHEILVRVLWEVIQGNEKRVIFEIGPRMGKTELAVRMFISFMQGYFEFIKNQYITYGAELTEDTSVDIKTIMESSDYQELFPKVEFHDSQNKKSNWKLKSGTEFFGSSIGGALTGKGSMVTVLDDPLKAHSADSKAERDNAWKFIQNSITTRLENDGAIVVIMQRLHEDDPVGRFVKEQGLKQNGGRWSVFSFPLVTNEDIVYEYLDFRYERKAGEILPNKNYNTKEQVDMLRIDMGYREFEKQQNQNVTVSETGYFNKEDTTYITDIDLPEQNLYISVDTAESLEVKADDRAISVVGWSIDENEIELITLRDGKRGKWDVYGVCEYLIELMMKYPKAQVKIEGAGGGITLGVVLGREILKANAKLRANGKPLISNGIDTYKPNTQISKQEKIKYMEKPYRHHQIKIHKSCDIDFQKNYLKELYRFDPEKKHQKDNCIDSVASSWLFAVPKKSTSIKKSEFSPTKKRNKQSQKWRGI